VILLPPDPGVAPLKSMLWDFLCKSPCLNPSPRLGGYLPECPNPPAGGEGSGFIW